MYPSILSLALIFGHNFLCQLYVLRHFPQVTLTSDTWTCFDNIQIEAGKKYQFLYYQMAKITANWVRQVQAIGKEHYLKWFGMHIVILHLVLWHNHMF